MGRSAGVRSSGDSQSSPNREAIEGKGERREDLTGCGKTIVVRQNFTDLHIWNNGDTYEKSCQAAHGDSCGLGDQRSRNRSCSGSHLFSYHER